MGVPALNMAPSMESGNRVKVSNVVEYSVPPTFRVTGPPKEGGEEGTVGGEILRSIEGTEREEKAELPGCVQNWVVRFRLSLSGRHRLEYKAARFGAHPSCLGDEDLLPHRLLSAFPGVSEGPRKQQRQ